MTTAPAWSTRSIRVIVVEDDEDMQGMLVEIIQRLGHTVLATDNAKEVLLSNGSILAT